MWRDFVENWNEKFPYDLWWRTKHNIPFGSKKHKESSPILQRIEFEEDSFFKEIKKQKESIDDTYKIGDWLNEQILNESEIDRAFDQLMI